MGMTAYKPIAHNIPSTWNEMRGLRVQSQLELHSERQGRPRATKDSRKNVNMNSTFVTIYQPLQLYLI